MNRLTVIVTRKTLVGTWSASVLAGIGLVAAGITTDGTAMWWLVACGLALLAFRTGPHRLAAVILLGLLIGNLQSSNVASNLRALDGLIGQNVELRGRIVDDPTYGKRSERVFVLGDISIGGRSYPGRVRVSSFSFVEVRRGDEVVMRGKMLTGFGPYQAKISFGDIMSVAKSDSLVLRLRDSFAASIYSIVPDPQASLGIGFLLGQRSVLPDTLDEQLKMLGLTHLVVASGYNLTILVRFARKLFENKSKYLALMASLGLMSGFVLVTGFSPSMTRASLVAVLSLLAWYYGRKIHPLVLLLFAAAVTGLWNPLYVWGDIGWYLSFLAFGGIMLLAPLVIARIWADRQPPMVGVLVVETLAAQLLTMPVMLLIFGSLPLLATVANVVVAPLIPLAMAATFVAGLAGWVALFTAAWLAMPAAILIGVIVMFVQWLAVIPGTSLVIHLNAAGFVVCYGLIIALILILWRITRYDFLRVNITDTSHYVIITDKKL